MSELKAILAKKQEFVSQLSEDIKSYDNFLIFEYLGLSAEEMFLLRKQFRDKDAKLIIHTNNVINRSFNSLNIKTSKPFKGPNAVFLTKKIENFQTIFKLFQEKKFLKPKLAYLDSQVLEDDNLNVLISLGSKPEMLSKLCRTIMSPVYRLLFLFREISNKNG